MRLDRHTLTEELATLRQRAGMQRADLMQVLGAQTRQLFGIGAEDTAAQAREKAKATVERLLPDDENRLAVLAALALHPKASQDELGLREERVLHGSESTRRRVVRKAFDGLVAAAIDRTDWDTWHFRAVRAELLLDGPGPVLTERRTIQIDTNGVTKVHWTFRLPQPTGLDGPLREPRTEIDEGGWLREQRRLSNQDFLVVVDLPQRLDEGEVHRLAVRYEFDPGQPMAPWYVLRPKLVPCDSLDLTVRFDLHRLPMAVWRLDGVAAHTVEAARPAADVGPLQRRGEVQASFRNLQQRRAYGVKWTP